MSPPPSPTPLHLPRRGWCAIAAIALLPWLAVVALLRRLPPPPAPAEHAPATAADPAADPQHGRPGPWGRLEYIRIVVEPPDDFIPTSVITPRPPRWIFRGYTPAQLETLWAEAGLSAAERQSLQEPARRQIAGDATVLTPDPQVLLGLAPAARAKIYTALAAFPENVVAHDPYRFRTDAVDDWFAHSEVPAEIVALTRQLLFPRGPNAVFADPDLVLPRLASTEERTHFIKTLSRKSALLVQLRLDPTSDVAALARYWGGGRRSKDITPLLQSLALHPGGGALDLVHLLPPFARLLLYTYPLPTEDPEALAHDCHWTSFNFYHDRADERFTHIDYVKQVLFTQYYPVGGEPAFGDIVMLVQPGERAIHSCVYVADDIVFTKNGTSFSVPWLLSPLENVIAFYSLHEPIEVRRYRAKAN